MRHSALRPLDAIAALCLLGAISPVHATIDMALDTSNYQNDGTAFTASVNGVIDDSTAPSVIVGAAVMVRFDPSKVSISNLHTESGSGWSLLASNTLHTADGWVEGVLYNNSDPGQTEDGPILEFTVTPANSTVDPADCDTLKFSGSESDMCDDQFDDYIPSDPCEGIYSPPGQDGNQLNNRVTLDTQTTQSSFTPDCPAQWIMAAQALRIVGGLEYGLLEDFDILDRDHDNVITMADVIALLREPCGITPIGWYTYQGNRSRTGRARLPINTDDPEHHPVVVWEQDMYLPAGFTPTVYGLNGDLGMRPSPVVVPNPDDPSRRIVYAITEGSGTDGDFSFLFRFVEPTLRTGTPPAPVALRLYADPNNPVPADRKPMYAVGTPLVVGDRIFITATAKGGTFTNEDVPYVLCLSTATLDTQGRPTFAWARPLPFTDNIGAVKGSVGWSPYDTQYTTGTGPTTHTHTGGCILVAFDAEYSYVNSAQEGSPVVTSTTGFMGALDPTNGHFVWGHVEPDGSLTPGYGFSVQTPSHDGDAGSSGGGQTSFYGTSPGGLPPMAYPVSQSSPSSDKHVAYVQDSSCYVNARDLTMGSLLWDNYKFHDGVESCVSVQDFWTDAQTHIEQLYFAGKGMNEVCMDSGINGGAVEWFMDGSTSGPPHYPDQVVATPAILRERNTVFVNDITGRMFSVDYTSRSEGHPTVVWQGSVAGGNDYWTSPLIAPGTTDGTFKVYLSGTDRLIHVCNADSVQTPTELQTLGDPQGVNGAGLLNAVPLSSLAAWGGRMFVLTPSVVPDQSSTVAPARVICYGR